MVLVTHKLQGSHILFPRSSPTWSKGLIPKRCVARVHVVGRKDNYLRLKQTFRFSLRAPCNGRLTKAKHFGVTSFKDGRDNRVSGGSESSVKLSYLPDDGDETNINGSPKAQNRSLSYASDTEDSISGQSSFQNLFKKWLLMLRTQSPAKEGGVLEKQLPQMTKSETQTEIRKMESVQSTSTVWSLLWSLDATIKIPLLLFIPGFTVVNLIYGAEVTKELLPLWVVGPLVVALYVKVFQGLCALYAFCFRQTVSIIKNLPAFFLLTCNYISQGKLKADVRSFVLGPVVAIKNMDYKEVLRTRLKELREWITEKYLDYVESIWPYYCRTIRFLKSANLI